MKVIDIAYDKQSPLTCQDLSGPSVRVKQKTEINLGQNPSCWSLSAVLFLQTDPLHPVGEMSTQ